MAQLAKTSYQLPTLQTRDASRSYIPIKDTEHHKAFERLRELRDTIGFGVADGYAWYLVKSRKPLVLQHIDYLDGYAVSAATIRGLRAQDIEDYARRSKMGFKF